MSLWIGSISSGSLLRQSIRPGFSDREETSLCLSAFKQSSSCIFANLGQYIYIKRYIIEDISGIRGVYTLKRITKQKNTLKQDCLD